MACVSGACGAKDVRLLMEADFIIAWHFLNRR